MYKYWEHENPETGHNYFRTRHYPDGVVKSCIRVIVRPGKLKKGRTNCYGVHEIKPPTFVANWLCKCDIKECTEQQFFKAYDFVADRMLSTL
jgi:hypothetical protein